MTLAEFMKEEIQRLQRFGQMWTIEQVKQGKENFPDEMEPGEWDQQYLAYDELEPRPMTTPEELRALPDRIFAEIITVDEPSDDFGPYRWRRWSIKPFEGATEYRRVHLAERESAGTVAVKPLEWSPAIHGGECALGAAGLYHIYPYKLDGVDVFEVSNPFNHDNPTFPTKGAAQAAAQADYEARIRSALNGGQDG